MSNAPLPDMSSGIISIWFRDARQNPAPPPEPDWPSGVWSAGTNSMVPPDIFQVAKADGYKQNIFYWNSYGQYITGGGITLPLLGPAAVMMATPPPFVIDQMHTLLTFGNPDQSYEYYPWQVKFPNVIEAVQYVPMIISGPQWSVPSWPPPYAPWIFKYGKFTVTTMTLGDAPVLKPGYVPQSFIGVDKNGYLTICLQTDTKAKYKGYAFQLDKVTEIWATQSYFDAPVGHLESGHWVKVKGYWDGYEFWYTDISDKVMGAQPETFVIGGPPGAFDFVSIPAVNDGAWHHLLFSFDISGSVQVSIPSILPGGARPPTIVSTECKAWLALDGKNYSGGALQHRFAMHDGFQLPLLPGMGTDSVGFGPVTSATRANSGLIGGNDIMPRNCWILPFRGSPKDGLKRFASTAGTWNQDSTAFIQKGDYNFFQWTGSIWTLYHAGDWKGELDPPRPSSPDPATFDVPTYEGGPFNIPCSGYSIGIPASAHHLDHNTGLEMAELQIWINQTLDTGIEENRRLFVDKDGKPVPPKEAEKILGKPHVLLHGSSNWKSGRNTGSTGVDAKGNVSPVGQFQTIAKIERFRPDPQLGK
jgi:hypothetical protein